MISLSSKGTFGIRTRVLLPSVIDVSSLGHVRVPVKCRARPFSVVKMVVQAEFVELHGCGTLLARHDKYD